jgi:hypothetical protein
MRVLLLILATTAAAAALAAPATADPTRHFDLSFTIVCGGHEYVIVSKPGSSNILTVDGQPSTGVSVLFGLYVTDENGDVVVDFRKPGAASANATVCTDTSWPLGWSATA